jgi:hypothetical protein
MIDSQEEKQVIFEADSQEQAYEFVRANRFNVLFYGIEVIGNKVLAWRNDE